MLRKAINRHDVNDRNRQKLTFRIDNILSHFNNHSRNTVFPRSGLTISEMHHSLKSTKPQVERPLLPGENTQKIHILRHAETGFVEMLRFDGSDDPSEFDIVCNMLDDVRDAAGMAIFTDEKYTSFELLYELTNQNYPFLGCITNSNVDPDFLQPCPTGRKLRIFSELSDQYWLWVCFQESDQKPVVLISNFHLGAINNWNICEILDLYHRSVYGSEKFNRMEQTFDNVINHPFAFDVINLVYYIVTTSVLTNSMLLLDQDGEKKFRNLYQFYTDLLLGYCTDISDCDMLCLELKPQDS